MGTRTNRMGLPWLVAGLILATGAFAQGNTSNNGANTQTSASSSTANSDALVLVDPAKIYNENPMSWVGKSVVLQNVTVEDTNDTGNFWVGSDNDHRLLVVKEDGNDNLKVMKFHKGDVVVVAGTIEAASRYKAETTSAESGSMHDAQQTPGVLLLARDIKVSSSTHE